MRNLQTAINYFFRFIKARKRKTLWLGLKIDRFIKNLYIFIKMDTIPVIKETYELLAKELENLKKVERPRILQEIAEARAQGDLSENFEYHSAKDQQGKIESRIQFLEDRVARAVVIEHDTASAERILFGATVKVKDLAFGKEYEYKLVSPEGSDPINGKISSVSPIGKALIGKTRGDKVDVQTPKKVIKFEILDYK
jgi:transcription elongation factor GreA